MLNFINKIKIITPGEEYQVKKKIDKISKKKKVIKSQENIKKIYSYII
jgi:predicted HAD superfamily hydrolase